MAASESICTMHSPIQEQVLILWVQPAVGLFGKNKDKADVFIFLKLHRTEDMLLLYAVPSMQYPLIPIRLYNCKRDV